MQSMLTDQPLDAILPSRLLTLKVIFSSSETTESI